MASSGGSWNTSVTSHPTFSFSTQFMTASTDLLTNNDHMHAQYQDSTTFRSGIEIPNFNSLPPSSLLPISPSSYLANPPGFSPIRLFDSPVLLSTSNVLPSPATGAFAGLDFKDERNFSDFYFQLPQTRPTTTSSSMFHSSANPIPSEESFKRKYQGWDMNKPSEQTHSSSVKAGEKSEFAPVQSFPTEISRTQISMQINSSPLSSHIHSTQPSHYLRKPRKSEDGYNWRKYGQKQVKRSENPRSYYKCTYPNCPTKKKVESTLDGHITEIVYKGTHNHPKPQSTRRSSSQSIQPSSCTNSEISNQLTALSGNTQMECNSSVSFGEDDFDQGSSISKSDDGNENEPEAKRWKGENENEAISACGSTTVREPRIVVQTTSNVDVLDDGYRWRKYGQKVVKGNPNPRSYYKCTYMGCSVRKHVERASHEPRAVITAYEGKHNHEVPAARGGGHGSYPANRSLSDNGNSNAPSAVRPLAMTNNLMNRTTNYPSNSLGPFTLEMLQSPAERSFGIFSGFGNSPGSYVNQMQADYNVCSSAKEEPKDDSCFKSFLY